MKKDVELQIDTSRIDTSKKTTRTLTETPSTIPYQPYAYLTHNSSQENVASNFNSFFANCYKKISSMFKTAEENNIKLKK